MSVQFRPILSFALRQLLASRLQNNCYVKRYLTRQTSLDDLPTPQIQEKKLLQYQPVSNNLIPIKRLSQSQQITYVSAIAFKVQTQQYQSTLEFAEQIAIDLMRTNDVDNALAQQPLDRIWQNFTIQVTPPGWIYFRLNEQGLSEWLQLQVNQTPEIAETYPDFATDFTSNVQTKSELIRDSTNIFLILHTYARCCAVLRLGSQLRLVKLNQTHAPQRGEVWKITQPDPLPWLILDRTLRLTHPAEWHLLDRLCTVIDDLSSTHLPLSQEQCLKWAVSLSQNFQRFHASCRICGEVSSTDRDLAQVRLGLTMATQALLKSLIELCLTAVAPSEL